MVTPYQRHSETSRQSAGQLRRDLTLTMRERVVQALEGSPATDEELCQRTGLGPSTERPRRVELVADGQVRDSGERRRTLSGRRAVVWELSRPTVQLRLL